MKRIDAVLVGALLIGGCSAAPPGSGQATQVGETVAPATTVANVARATPPANEIQSTSTESTSPPSTKPPPATPSATPTHTPKPFSRAKPLPLPGLGGRIVWVNQWKDEEVLLGTVNSFDVLAGPIEKMWTDEFSVRRWSIAPRSNMTAYVTVRDGINVLMARRLMPEAKGTVVARSTMLDTTVAQAIWDQSGQNLVYAVHDFWGTENESRPCEYRVVDSSGQHDTAIWSGEKSEFPNTWSCGYEWYWEPGSERIALFEHPHESTYSKQVTTVGRNAKGAIGRLAVANESHARAQSADRVWIALLDSASYYAARFALSDHIYVDPDRWPGRSLVRLFNIQTGGLVDLGAWETDVGFTQPVWSPDGAWIAFAEPKGTFIDPTPMPSPNSTRSGYPSLNSSRVTSARGPFRSVRHDSVGHV